METKLVKKMNKAHRVFKVMEDAHEEPVIRPEEAQSFIGKFFSLRHYIEQLRLNKHPC